jgi:hypothetical protein
VTENLKKAVLETGLTGVDFDYVKISVSYEFKQLYPATVLPTFTWMKICRKAGEDDFGISDRLLLILSMKAYNLLSLFNISAADVRDYI